jgi:hypothetical protein
MFPGARGKPTSIHGTAPLAECLRRRTIGLFLKLGLIIQHFAVTLLCWKHSGREAQPLMAPKVRARTT